MREDTQVTYDSLTGDGFVVITPEGVYKFRRGSPRLHYLDSRDLQKNGGAYYWIAQDNAELRVLDVLPSQEENIEARDTRHQEYYEEAMETLCYLGELSALSAK